MITVLSCATVGLFVWVGLREHLRTDYRNSGSVQDQFSSDSFANNDNPDAQTDGPEDHTDVATDSASDVPTASAAIEGDLAMDFNPSDYDYKFYSAPIDEKIFARISGLSYPEGCPVSLHELSYLHVAHFDFEGNIVSGELIVNSSIADTVLDVFKELFAIKYPIEKIVLIDEYDADDELSMEDNNSSAFNYRFIAESTVLSNHALGYAIDINPLYNPYVYVRSDGTEFLQPTNAGDYVDRTTGNPYYILKDDACYNIFISHGFSWGGDWTTKKDYQHFEYPHD